VFETQILEGHMGDYIIVVGHSAYVFYILSYFIDVARECLITHSGTSEGVVYWGQLKVGHAINEGKCGQCSSQTVSCKVQFCIFILLIEEVQLWNQVFLQVFVSSVKSPVYLALIAGRMSHLNDVQVHN
jgi:hypothetical protein